MNQLKAHGKVSNVIPNEREESGFLAIPRNDKPKACFEELKPMRSK